MIDDGSRVCGVCGRVLEQRQLGRKTYAYSHGLAEAPFDHPAVPIRRSDAPEQVRQVCDFCYDEPTTHVLVVDHEIENKWLGVVWDTEWAMCQECSDLTLADDWLALRRRAFELTQRRHGRMDERGLMEMRLVFKEIRESVLFFYVESEAVNER